MRNGPHCGEREDRAASSHGCASSPAPEKRPSGSRLSMLGARLRKRRRITILAAVIAIVLVASLGAAIAFAMIEPPATTPGTTHPIAPTPVSSIAYERTVTDVGGTYAVIDADGATVHESRNALSAIRAAIGSLTPDRTAKEAVLLRGDFVISGTIELPSYTILVLDGRIAWEGSEHGYMVAASGQHDIEVQGGVWDGNRGERSMTSDNNPMEFVDCSNVVIADLYVHDGAYDNIECVDCVDVLITNIDSSFTNWNSILMAGCDNCVIENSRVHDSEQGGIYFYTEDDGTPQTINNNIVRGCWVESTLTSGISFSIRGVEDRTDSGLIENNTVVDCGRDTDHPGINIGWGASRLATNTAVRGNTIYSTTSLGEGGIEFAGNGCVCEGNIIRDTPGYAIHLVGTNNKVIGNTITNAGWDDGGAGVSVEGSSNTITGNTISDCSTYGIRVHKGLFNTLRPNEFSGNGKDIA